MRWRSPVLWDGWFGNDFFPNPVLTILSSDNPLPAAEVLASGDVNLEEWEAVLVSVTAECDNPDLGFAEWSINDGSGGARVNDRAYDAFGAGVVEAGRTYRVTAPTGYAYGNWKIEARDSTDVVRLGCTDSTFPNYWPLANEDDGSCANIPGCTDPAADNYNPDATSDDGSCIITGCTDPTALNYNEAATVADNDLCYYTCSNILVNEIHYNPCDAQGPDFDWEFVEFYNAGEEADLSGYEVWFAFSNPEALSVALTFPAGTVIPADSYFLVVPGAVAEANYTDQGITVFLMENGNWGNGGGTVQLQDAYGNVLDAVTYDDATPWPAQEINILGNILAASPDGGCASLELIMPTLNNDVETTGKEAGWTTARRVRPTVQPSVVPTARRATTAPSPYLTMRAALMIATDVRTRRPPTMTKRPSLTTGPAKSAPRTIVPPTSTAMDRRPLPTS